MKYFFLLLILASSIVVCSQEKNCFLLSLETLDRIEVKLRSDLKPKLFLLNVGGCSTGVLEKLYLVPRTSEWKGQVLYEIFKVEDCDTIDYTSLVRVQIGQYKKKIDKYVTVQSNKKHFLNITQSVPGFYFSEPGIYKIRFIMRRNLFKPELPVDIYSDWKTIAVQ